MNLPYQYLNYINTMLDGIKLNDLRNVVFNIIDKYKNNEGEEGIINDELKAKVYVAYRVPATFGSVYEASRHTFELYKENISTVLDVGSGPGTSIIALNELIDFTKATLLEKEDSMINIGKSLLNNDEELSSKCNYIKGDLNSSKLINSDLVISSYVLNEIGSNNFKSILDKLWEATNKVLIIVEPGTKKGFEIVKEARDYLLSKEAKIIAPCTHLSSCPIKGDDWCHFTIRVERSKIHRLIKDASLPYEDEKFSYIALAKEKCSRSNIRILKEPKVTKASVIIDSCHECDIEKIKIKIKDKENYKKAKKAKWGDSFSY